MHPQAFQESFQTKISLEEQEEVKEPQEEEVSFQGSQPALQVQVSLQADLMFQWTLSVLHVLILVCVCDLGIAGRMRRSGNALKPHRRVTAAPDAPAVPAGESCC